MICLLYNTWWNSVFGCFYSCFLVWLRVICLHNLQIDTDLLSHVFPAGSPPPQRNGPWWRRADLRSWSFEKSRNIHEQWSDRLWQTATCITWWTVAKLYAFVHILICFHGDGYKHDTSESQAASKGPQLCFSTSDWNLKHKKFNKRVCVARLLYQVA